jgi:hypothetical protein
MLAQTLGAPIECDPREAILQAIYWSAGHVEFYRRQVQALAPDALVHGILGEVRTERTGAQAGTTLVEHSGPVVSMWLKLYNEERDRHSKVCVEAIRVGIDERRVRVEEQQAALLVEGLRWLASEAGSEFGWQDLERQAFDGIMKEMLQRLDRLEDPQAARV